MAAPRIRAQIVFFIHTPATSKAAPEDRCRALTKLKNAADHQVPQCTRRKVPDTSRSRAQKSHRDIVADELCNQHKLMLDRFSVMITQQLREEDMATPVLTSDPPMVARASAGTATAQMGSRNGAKMGVSDNMVFNHGMGFGNGMTFTGDMNLDNARGHRSPNACFMGDAAPKTRSTSSSTSSISLGVSHHYESRHGVTVFNSGTYSSRTTAQAASSFMSRNDSRRSDFDTMNTTAGPSTIVDTADSPLYSRITGNFDTRIAGLNNPFIAPSVSGTHSNQIVQIDDSRCGTPKGRENPQLYRTIYTVPSFQEAPNVIVNHAPKRLVPSNKAARDHSSLVSQYTHLTGIHKPHSDHTSAGTVDRQKKRTIEIGIDLFRAEIPLTSTSKQDLGAALDGLLLLDDTFAGSLISDCEALLKNHMPAAEGSLSRPDGSKLNMMRLRTRA